MNKTVTESAFKVAQVEGTPVTGAFEWIGNSRVFDPAPDLIPGAGASRPAAICSAHYEL